MAKPSRPSAGKHGKIKGKIKGVRYLFDTAGVARTKK